ncbi:hypothetical protein [Massilia sp. TS11]|uniref:hypothetical protein n=1 Tax=Massilia sp. TS11 TaxID=2908003 RepID=UPI001EDBC7C5|nr:hypothetical protein [Massilia sp. TS11]MCG2583342.1 hypothetical protein [Massilia sp. TS11]
MSDPIPPTRARYLVRSRGDNRALHELIPRLDPTVRVIDRIGPSDDPHTLVLEMSSTSAAALGEQLKQDGRLILEPDRPLSMFQ